MVSCRGRFAVPLLLIGLAACAGADSARPSDAASGNPEDWRFASGKPPTRIEYAAVVAACRDGAIIDAKGGPLDACLADLGLRRHAD